jgi:ABC-2 type transport system permease protein
VLALVHQQRGWIAGWSVGLALLAFLLVSIARLLVDTLRAGAPALQQYVVAAGIAGYADFVGVAWFGTALLFISVFVVVQASAWAADDAEGRLALVLAQPVARDRVVLERCAALLVAVAIIAALSTLCAALAARAGGIDLPPGRTVLAAVLMLPVAFAEGGLGLALVSWRPRLAVLVLGALTVASYFTQQLAPLFGWPEWVRRTSVFALYGQPLSRDDWGGIAILVAAGAAGLILALAALRRRDVGS